MADPGHGYAGLRGRASLRFLAGLLLLPACLGVSTALLALLRPLSGSSIWLAPETIALGGGYLAWIVLFLTLPAPARAYIFAHEATHAIWGFLCGSRVRRLRVTRSGGSVTLSNVNALVLLAPYFFPFYTVLVILLFGVFSWFADSLSGACYWLAAIGFTWGFHLTFTLRSLFQRQTDVIACGRLFSYVTIYLFNLLGICLWTAAVTRTGAVDFAVLLGDQTAQAYRAAGLLLFRGFWRLTERMGAKP